MTDLTFLLTAGTDVGLVRTTNEDNFVVNPDLRTGNWCLPQENESGIKLGPYGSLLVVADGMGGMNAGNVASEIAVNTIKDIFKPEALESVVESESRILKFLTESVIIADKNIKYVAREDPSTTGMGTTIVISWILDAKVYICWCGDSRAYLYNAASGLVRLTKDHSFVQQLVDDGKLDSELAFDHPNSNIITRSLGDSSSAAKPDSLVQTLKTGDLILLCTDGLCGLCRDSQIEEIIANNTDCLNKCCESLINAALSNGGYDNVTIAMLKVNSQMSDEPLSNTFTDYSTISKKKLSLRRILIFTIFAAIVLITCYCALRI